MQTMEPDDIAVEIITGLLESHTGQKLTTDRRWRIASALGGMLREQGITSNQELVILLTQPDNSDLATELVEALLNNETYFFRDRAVFEKLADSIIPDIAEKRQDERQISIWCCGCSTGQEALSLAMLFAEQHRRWKDWDISILATDVSGKVIDFARQGLYSQFQVQRGLGVAQMLRFFVEEKNGWRAAESLREMVSFEKHNLLDPPPYPRNFDLILCRNVLMYFDDATRERAIGRMSEAIADDGWLVLGGGEANIGRSGKFRPTRNLVTLFQPVPKVVAPPEIPKNQSEEKVN